MRMLIHEVPPELRKTTVIIRKWLLRSSEWRVQKEQWNHGSFPPQVKLIQRETYGYRNFENYCLRMLVECEGF